MNQKKAKQIRRVMRKEAKAERTYRFVTHPKPMKNLFGEPLLRYTFQYICDEGKTLLKFAKKVHDQTGVLPQ